VNNQKVPAKYFVYIKTHASLWPTPSACSLDQPSLQACPTWTRRAAGDEGERKGARGGAEQREDCRPVSFVGGSSSDGGGGGGGEAAATATAAATVGAASSIGSAGVVLLLLPLLLLLLLLLLLGGVIGVERLACSFVCVG